MKNFRLYISIITILIMSTSTNQAHAQDGFIVIVNKSVKEESLSQSAVRRIYFGFTTQWKNFERVKPSYMTIPNDAFWSYISTEEGKFKSYWTKRVFSGNGVAPVPMMNGEDVIDYVSRTSGAIGIVPDSLKDKLGDCRMINLE
ncbi:MAG: hypothetical protein ABJG78_19080 [Cyclobacteriaceae bacterium]